MSVDSGISIPVPRSDAGSSSWLTSVLASRRLKRQARPVWLRSAKLCFFKARGRRAKSIFSRAARAGRSNPAAHGTAKLSASNRANPRRLSNTLARIHVVNEAAAKQLGTRGERSTLGLERSCLGRRCGEHPLRPSYYGPRTREMELADGHADLPLGRKQVGPDMRGGGARTERPRRPKGRSAGWCLATLHLTASARTDAGRSRNRKRELTAGRCWHFNGADPRQLDCGIIPATPGQPKK
jgi:hypothetical protein